MIGIYKITNPLGAIYIGQSINLKRREASYRCNGNGAKFSKKLYESILYHGWDSHSFEVIEETKKEELNSRERFYQELYNANSEFNLNVFLQKTKFKKGVGKKLTELQKETIGNFHRGKVNSAETRMKIKKARAKQVITEAHKQAISDNSGSARIVLNQLTGVFYNSAKEAAKAHNIKHNTLVGWLIGRNKNKSHLIYV